MRQFFVLQWEKIKTNGLFSNFNAKKSIKYFKKKPAGMMKDNLYNI